MYDAARKCALNEELKEEWQKYREETERHVQVLHDVMVQMQLAPEVETPGRKIVRIWASRSSAASRRRAAPRARR